MTERHIQGRAWTIHAGAVAWICISSHVFAQTGSPPPPAIPADVLPPKVKTQVAPTYPSGAVDGHASAQVILNVTVKADGSVDDVDVFQSGGSAFDQAAIEGVKQWQFEPAMRLGQAIASRVRIPFRFDPPSTGEAPGKPGSTEVPPPASPSEAARLDHEATSQPPLDAASEPRAVPIVTPAQGLEVQPAWPLRAEPTTTGPTSAVQPNEAGQRADSSIEPAAGAASKDDEATFGASASAVATHAQRHPPRAASDFVITREIIAIAPHADAGSVLSTAPGIYVSRPEGEAIAHEIYLRGFDAEHGQDIALSAAGIPINQPSHLHGQGYADLNFIPPEVIRAVRVTEGVYDPHQGDFAVAGSVDFDLGVIAAERGIRSSTSLGSFGTIRQLLLWAPPEEDEATFGVAAFSRTYGFGENRGSMSGLGMAQWVLGSPNAPTTLYASAYGARSNLAGVLRRDDVEAGRVGFYDSYADPSAQAQSAFSSRLQFGVRHDRVSHAGGHLSLGLWLMSTDFKLRENFTGYLERSMQMPEWVGRGDLIEQSNQDLALGGEAAYKTPAFKAAGWFRGSLETGLSFRSDSIDQAQNLLQPPQNETWDRRVDASVRGADIGAFADVDLRFWSWLTIRGGGRADVLYYDVDDRLGNFIPRFRRETYIIGFRRTALGLALGPRGTIEAKVSPWLTLLVSGGRGYRSPQARQLDEGESAPYAIVDSAEVGARVKLGPPDVFTLTTAAYRTHLSLDLAFDPSEGSLERIGPTTRQGVAVQIQSKPTAWTLASISMTWVHATLDAPPPPTAAVPNPPYRRGQLLPYVPPLVVRGDLGAHHVLFALAGKPVDGRIGLGLTALAQRPLPYGEFSDAFALLDAAVHLRWQAVDFGIDVTNLLGTEYAASEYSFVSDWRQSPTPSLLPARHFAAGAPRIVMFNLGLTL
jgi:TonB family protein